jgi:hypothetical protein
MAQGGQCDRVQVVARDVEAVFQQRTHLGTCDQRLQPARAVFQIQLATAACAKQLKLELRANRLSAGGRSPLRWCATRRARGQRR